MVDYNYLKNLYKFHSAFFNLLEEHYTELDARCDTIIRVLADAGYTNLSRFNQLEYYNELPKSVKDVYELYMKFRTDQEKVRQQLHNMMPDVHNGQSILSECENHQEFIDHLPSCLSQWVDYLEQCLLADSGFNVLYAYDRLLSLVGQVTAKLNCNVFDIKWDNLQFIEGRLVGNVESVSSNHMCCILVPHVTSTLNIHTGETITSDLEIHID